MHKRTIAGVAAATGGAALIAASGATAASSTDAVRAVRTAAKGISSKPYELDRTRRYWEVTFADGTQKLVSLDGRRVARTRRDDRNRAVAEARVSLVSALRKAAPRAGQTRIEDADIEREDGRLVWKVGFTNDTDVEIDARTGRVVRVDRDDD